MKIKDYFKDRKKLEDALNFHISKRNLIKSNYAKDLVKAHLDKAKHNLELVDLTLNEKGFNDWSVIGLYYSLYHSCLALVVNKGFVSKNHPATLIFLISNYSELTCEEVEMVEELCITKADAEFYTDLKRERHDANYSTNILFSEEKVKELKEQTINLINKIEELLKIG